MTPSKNEHTGEFMITGAASDAYRDGWERIFGKKEAAHTLEDYEVICDTPAETCLPGGESCEGCNCAAVELSSTEPALSGQMPNPTEADLEDPVFEAIWQTIKSWDVNAPEYYNGYCGANGSHVMLILNAIRGVAC